MALPLYPVIPYGSGSRQRSKGRSSTYLPSSPRTSILISAFPGFDSDSNSATVQWNQRMQNSRMASPWVTSSTLDG